MNEESAGTVLPFMHFNSDGSGHSHSGAEVIASGYAVHRCPICTARYLAKAKATIAELEQLLAAKNHTANVFMNQVRKLQAKEAQMEKCIREGLGVNPNSSFACFAWQSDARRFFPHLAGPKR